MSVVRMHLVQCTNIPKVQLLWKQRRRMICEFSAIITSICAQTSGEHAGERDTGEETRQQKLIDDARGT